MSFEIRFTVRFEKSAKALSKRHRSFKDDLRRLTVSLKNNPMQGVELSSRLRKIRLAIKSKGRGKSGGARVIIYTICVSETEGCVYLLDVYDKSDFSSADVAALKKISSELEL